jgi:uroporphyrinogen-III synthase
LYDGEMIMQEHTLSGRTVAVPESRELDVFASMLERRGARVVRCPLVAIIDAPDPAPVLAWLRSFASGAMDDLILLTGEGLRRMLSCIDQHEPALKANFIALLARVRKITRGPKPARALRELGLKPDIAAATPTTQGVIDSLRGESLSGRTIGVQLYGDQPNTPLIEFLTEAGANVRSVAPYRYADQSDDGAVRELLNSMSAGEIDVIAFTSSAQVERLFAVGGVELCRNAFAKTEVAAIGPVVAQALAQRDIEVRLTPKDSYFMKPLTSALADALGPKTGHSS